MRRRRAGMPNSNKQASAAPPAAYQGFPRSMGRTKAPLVAAVVRTVSVPVPAVAPVMLTGDVCAEAEGGGIRSPAWAGSKSRGKATFPVKPPLGVTVIVDVLPLVAPGELMEMAPPLVRANELAAQSRLRHGRGLSDCA